MWLVGYLELSTVHLYLGPLQNETWEGWYASHVSKSPPSLGLHVLYHLKTEELVNKAIYGGLVTYLCPLQFGAGGKKWLVNLPSYK